ncbi:MAG: VCBS repeat-containing protein, partial [Phycisphaerales bacterium]|nr:VCBS repeat-containing protein [Phycisphaerales bacterium]
QTKLAPDPTCGMSLGSIVAFGDGNGNFTPTVCLVGGSFPIDVAIADYNGDGHQDVAIANNVTHGITTFLGGGDGTFGAGIDLPVAYWTNYTDVVTADFDEDGIPDLAASHYNGAYIFHGNGDGTFAVAGSTGSNVLLEAIDAGDLNGDAHVDVALTEIYDNRLLLCPGNGDGTFGACDTRTVGGFMREVGIADLNRDGLGDAAVSWQSGNQVRVFLGTGGGAFDAGTSFGVGLQPTPMVFVDLNEDGWLDVVEANRNLGDQSYLSTLIQIPQVLGCIDGDADGYGDPASPACAFPDLDCDDANAAVNPGAAEDCGNGIDDDCNGLVDAADPACAPVCTDADGDGYALEGGACGLVDCDDANAAVNPGAAEVCGNGIDDNCNGLIDGADPACAAGCAPVRAAGPRTGAAWVYLGTAVLVAGAGLRVLYRRRQGK